MFHQTCLDVTVVVLAVNCLTFLLKYNWICTKMSYFKWKSPKKFWGGLPRRARPLPSAEGVSPSTQPTPLGAYGASIEPPNECLATGLAPMCSLCDQIKILLSYLICRRALYCYLRITNTLCLKKIYAKLFCHNFVKFSLCLIIFGKRMANAANNLKYYEVHWFSTSFFHPKPVARREIKLK